MELSSCINYLLTVTQHEVFARMSDRLAEYGVTPGQYGVLNCVWNGDGASPKEIAQILYLENSTVSGVLDRMQKKGLIDRLIDPEDRRGVKVVALAPAYEIKEGVLNTVQEVNDEILGRFTPEELQNLLSCLRRIAGTVELS